MNDDLLLSDSYRSIRTSGWGSALWPWPWEGENYTRYCFGRYKLPIMGNDQDKSH
jgi:hypothetical protein